MTTEAIAILWPGLRRILVRIGRWVLRNVIIEGARGIAVYLRMRARHFIERHSAEESPTRRRRLRRRARRYSAAAAWFDEHANSLTERALEVYDRQSRRIPDCSAYETE